MTNYLDDIINFLKAKAIVFHNKNNDGRINSATNEELVLTAILSYPKFSTIVTFYRYSLIFINFVKLATPSQSQK